MKYLWGIGLGKDPGFSASAGTVTLSGSGSHPNVESENVELIVNISRNIVLYNRNNPDLTATFTGGGAADTVVQLPSGVTGATADLIHVWVEISDGRSGIDFLSELAVKDRTYAAIKNTDITLEAETLNIDFTSTNEKIDTTNQRIDTTNAALGGTGSTGASENEYGSDDIMGHLMTIESYTKSLSYVNALNIGQGVNSSVDEKSVIGQLMRLDFHQGSTASATGDISVIGQLMATHTNDVAVNDMMLVDHTLSTARNTSLGSTASATGDISVIGQLRTTNVTLEVLSGLNTSMQTIAINQGSTASSSEDGTVIGLHKKTQELLLGLLDIPLYPTLAVTIAGPLTDFGVVGIDLGASGSDFSKSDTIVSVRSMSPAVELNLGSFEQFISLGGTAVAAEMAGFTGDILGGYALDQDDTFQTNAKLIQVKNKAGGAGARIQVTLVNTF